MNPIKTKRYDGVYGAPTGLENEIGGLPYYREKHSTLDTNIIFSIWEPTTKERKLIAAGHNILVGQVGEPIHPISLQITALKEN